MKVEPTTVNVSITEVEDLAPAMLRVALSTLARLMVRAYRQNGDPEAMVSDNSASPSLTVVRDPSPHPNEDEAA
jgi:hypothetical protein